MSEKKHKGKVHKFLTHFSKSNLSNKVSEFAKSEEFYSLIKKLYFVVLVVIVFFTVYHIGYTKRIIPGVRVGDIFVGGLTYDQAVEALTKHNNSLKKDLKLVFDSRDFEIKGETISLEYNIEATVSRAFDLGRSGNIFVDTKDKLASLVKTIQLKTHYDVDSGSLSSEFSRIKGEINVEPTEATFKLANNVLIIEPSYDGQKVDDQHLYDTVINSLEKMNFRERKLSVENLKPQNTKEDLEKVYDKVNNLVFNKIEIIYQDKKWMPTVDQMLEFVSVEKDGRNVEVGLNRAKFQSYVNQIKLEVDELPRGNVTAVQNNLVTGFEVTRKGRELNTSKLVSEFKDAFLNQKSQVFLDVAEIAELNDPSRYGIFSLIGEGSSKFTGSIPARVNNLTLAAARIDGIIVPPGETFSFNNSVGEISGRTGYDTAYIISNGRTVLGEGGGVCQTSTTLFRAVLNSGLPVVVRHPHAYRVGYYELDGAIGIDASVFQPLLDFQFKNDTPNHILIQSSWDTAAQTLNFKIYGTPDGRSVEISTPVVTNLIPPPEPLYQDDPTLEKGKTKQVDWAAWGAKASFTRKVTRDDEVLYEDSFKSTYQPWRAIFLVGAKEDD
uniref:G5 domain-containing protein n=1 Tax=candidate division WWE3 bacterium TaxID=2053526 RepID=A0A7C4XIL9_UNCKA